MDRYSEILDRYNKILDRYMKILHRYNEILDRYNGKVDVQRVNIIYPICGCDRFRLVIMQLLLTSHGKTPCPNRK